MITSIALIPLSSQSEAQQAIEKTNKETKGSSSRQTSDEKIDYDSSADEGSYHSDGQITDDSHRGSKSLSPPYETARRKSQEDIDSVAQDVIHKRGQYGRFAERWFSTKGWTTERRRVQGMSADDVGKQETDQTRERRSSAQVGDGYQGPSGGPGQAAAAVANPAPKNILGEAPPQKDVGSTLLPKLLQTTKILFASRSFFFSYDFDITRRLGDRKTKAPNLSLHQTVDPLVGCRTNLPSMSGD